MNIRRCTLFIASLLLLVAGLVGLPTTAQAAGPISPAPAPTFTGEPRVGERLTIDTTGWAQGTTFSYEWFIDGVQEPGATGFDWQLRPQDVDHVFVGVVTGHLAGFDDVRKETAPITILGEPFTVTPTPTVSGTPQYGATLTVATGSWETGTTLTYEWLRDGAPIAGATGTSYLISAADVGRKLSVRVTGRKPGRSAASVSSLPTAAVSPATLAAGAVTIAGKPQVGKKLSARPSGFDAGVATAFQWLVGTKVVGTQATLKLTKALTGKRIVLRATVTKAGYSTATVDSAPTPKVKKAKKVKRHSNGK